MLAETVKRPYSYTLTYGFFPSESNVHDQTGKLVSTIYQRPLQDKLPTNFDAVEAGKRNIFWRSDKPNTLIWCAAPDGGDPAKTVEHRDELFESDAPFANNRSLCLIKNRFSGIEFGNDGLAIVSDYWWKTRNTQTYIINPTDPKQAPRVIYTRSSEDVYSDPGDFVSTYNQYNR